MGTKTQDSRRLIPDKANNGLVSWINQQIETNNFKNLSAWLEEFSAEQSDKRQPSEIQNTAIQLCRICQNHQEEMDASWAAYQRAVEQEKALSANLSTILTLLLEQSKSSQPIPNMVEQSKKRPFTPAPAPPKLWKKIQEYIGLAKDPAIADGDSSVSSNDELAPAMSEMQEHDSKRPSLTVYCLGQFQVYINDKPINNWNGNKGKVIFKYLLINRKHPIPLEVLMDTFWRNDEPESARRNLYQAIYLLRQALQQENEDFPYVLSQNGTYTLNPDLNIWVDSELFMAHYENGRRLQNDGHLEKAITAYEAAESLYGDDFLIEDPYEEWPQAQRENLKQTHLYILDSLSRYHYNLKNWAMCLTYYQRILTQDNCREDAHRGLMRVYYFQKQRHLALRQYHQCAKTLQQELAVPPMPETTNLHQKIQKNQLHFSSI